MKLQWLDDGRLNIDCIDGQLQWVTLTADQVTELKTFFRRARQ